MLSNLQPPSPPAHTTSGGRSWLTARQVVWLACLSALPARAAGMPGATGSEPLLQGFFLGASLVPLLYGGALWARLRDARLAAYTAAVAATVAFFAAIAGLGDQPAASVPSGLATLAVPLHHLLAACAACCFACSETGHSTLNARLARGLRACATAAGGAAVLLVTGLLNSTVAHTLALALGVAPLLLALPGTSRHRRASDPAGHWTLRRGGPFTLSMLMGSAGLQGAWALGLCGLPVAQFGSLVALTLGLAVLGERLTHGGAATTAAPGRQRQAQAQAQADPNNDALTGALNTQGLHAAAHSRLSHCTPQRPVAVLHAELDGFQAVSQALGPQAGDAVLLAAAERLRAHLRATDLVCRLDGARFAVVLGPLSPDFEKDVRFIATKLQKAFEPPFSAGDTMCCVGLNLGTAIAPQHDTSLAPLLERARARSRAGSGLPSQAPSLQPSG